MVKKALSYSNYAKKQISSNSIISKGRTKKYYYYSRIHTVRLWMESN